MNINEIYYMFFLLDEGESKGEKRVYDVIFEMGKWSLGKFKDWYKIIQFMLKSLNLYYIKLVKKMLNLFLEYLFLI